MPLSVAFSTPSALAVLRVLSREDMGMSVRGLARAAGINHQTCACTLRVLESARLVEFHRIGKSKLARLNQDNAILADLVLPFLDQEQRMVEDIESSIHRSLDELCHKVILQGVTSGMGGPFNRRAPIFQAGASRCARGDGGTSGALWL